jgi:hypothetical protein
MELASIKKDLGPDTVKEPEAVPATNSSFTRGAVPP